MIVIETTKKNFVFHTDASARRFLWQQADLQGVTPNELDFTIWRENERVSAESIFSPRPSGLY